MFGEDNKYIELAESLLSDFDFFDVLEMNDLDETDVLALLIRQGLIDTSKVDYELAEDDD